MVSRANESQHVAYQLPAEAVIAALGSDVNRGLSRSEARARLARDGPNALEAEPPIPAWRRFLAQFQDTLVILLLIATAISIGLWVYERDTALPYEGLVILTIVLLNGVLGYVQEERSERAVTALRALAAANASVVRDGERQRIPTAELVSGDIILLEEGDTIPADARLIQSTALQIAEAPLTGESLPVAKETTSLATEVGVGDQHNMVFSGTAVTYGHGRAIVTATGMRTEIGAIAGLLRRTTADLTPLQKELDRTGKRLGLVVLLIAAVMVMTIVLVDGVSGFRALIDVLILGVALAVAAVPEGLAAVVTAVLAIGVQRMAQRHVIVRKLPAVETLGSATVIASDKTGTLTKNEMTVRTVVTASGRVDLSGVGYAPTGDIRQAGQAVIDPTVRVEVERTLGAADRANNAVVQERGGRWVVLGDPTEGALIVAARKVGLSEEVLATRFERVGEVPFSAERKLMTTLHHDAEQPERLLAFTKGAPEVLLLRCTHELIGTDQRALTPERRALIQATNEQLASEALRTLGLAARVLAHDPGAHPAHAVDDRVERELIFLGLVGMIDPPRPEVQVAVAQAKAAGIRPIMITGDHPQTASAIAIELEISPDGQAITGAELEAMPDSVLEDTVRRVSVYARVKPEHKLRIVTALRRTGQVVAMTGDGVNDAPALKMADIGVAMGITGTDVAKSAADMVLSDDNFASIVAAVEEGRAIFANIQKFLRYLLSSNVGEVLTMFLGVVLASTIGLPSQDDAGVVLPLLATQLLWINLVTDGAPALALGLDPVEPDVMRKPPRAPSAGVITARMWAGIVFVGLIVAVGTLGTLDSGLPGGLIAGSGDLTYARTLAFTTLVLFQLFNVFNARSDERSALHGLVRNPWLWGAVGLSLVLQLCVIYIPFLQRAFATVGLSVGDWLRCTLVASSVVWLREIGKLVTRRRGLTG